MGLYRNKETRDTQSSMPFDAANANLWEYFPCKFNAKDYNFVAKRLRENFPLEANEDASEHSRIKNLTHRGAITQLALDFARRYKEDNPNFDPLKFLDQCSPDTDLYPLSELWQSD